MKKLYLRTFGCQMNEYDSEKISDVLRAVRLTGTTYFHFELSAPWVVESPPSREIAGTVMPAAQRVIVGRNEQLLRGLLTAREVNWLSIAPLSAPRRAQIKIRNKHVAAQATLFPTDTPGRVEARFDEPQRAVTPGQAAVFYDADLVLGGGWIE